MLSGALRQSVSFPPVQAFVIAPCLWLQTPWQTPVPAVRFPLLKEPIPPVAPKRRLSWQRSVKVRLVWFKGELHKAVYSTAFWLIVTDRKGKVMFSLACVCSQGRGLCLFTGEGVWWIGYLWSQVPSWSLVSCPFRGVGYPWYQPPPPPPPPTVGTHPTFLFYMQTLSGS